MLAKLALEHDEDAHDQLRQRLRDEKTRAEAEETRLTGKLDGVKQDVRSKVGYAKHEMKATVEPPPRNPRGISRESSIFAVGALFSAK